MNIILQYNERIEIISHIWKKNNEPFIMKQLLRYSAYHLKNTALQRVPSEKSME